MVKSEMFATAFAAVVIVYGILFIGCEANEQAWTRDCEKLGQHREGDRVFVCSEKKVAP